MEDGDRFYLWAELYNAEGKLAWQAIAASDEQGEILKVQRSMLINCEVRTEEPDYGF